MEMIARRAFCVSAALVALGTAAPVLAKPAPEVIYIGQHGTTIQAARFNPVDGTLGLIGPVADSRRSTWALAHPRLPIVYFNEDPPADQEPSGGVMAYGIHATTGALTKLSDQRVGGAGTTHLWFDKASNTILAANYGAGSLVTLPVKPDGTVGAPTSTVKFTGSGPHKRQASSHAHGVSVSPDGHWALVTDLGADRVWVVPFDRQTGKLGALDLASPHHAVLPAGSGPRHMVWSASGQYLYVLTELTASLLTYRWDGAKGQLALVDSQSTDAAGYTGDKSASEIAISRDGRFLYTGNRGDNTLVVFALNGATGAAKMVQRLSSGGLMPWHFTLHASGRWVLVANRGSDSVNVLARDPKTGMLSATANKVSVTFPVQVFSRGQ
jgi:6-phosphogluconolactonase